MKYGVMILFCLLLCGKTKAQSFSINTDGSAADNSAILDVKSTTKGMLVPRMTKAQRNTISSPAKGLMVFVDDVDSVGFHYYNGSNWLWLEALGSAGWKTTGNAGTDTSVNFLGTTTSMPLRLKQNNQWLGQFNTNNGTYFIGKDAGKKNTISESVAIGDSAMANNITGEGNTAFGSMALKSNITGEFNTAIGTRTLEKNTNATGVNTAVGSYALSKNTDGVASTAIGSGALSDDNSIGFNVAVGFNALGFNTTGYANTAVGTNSLYRNETGIFNIAMGNNAMYQSDKADFNAAIGSEALRNDTSGYNTALGTLTLTQNRKGYAGVALGYASLTANTTGVGNTAAGAYSFLKNTTGNYSVAIGDSAGYNNTTASSNIFIGHQAGSVNTTGSNNTIVGADANVLTNNLSNATAIGFRAAVDTSNALVLGSIIGVNAATSHTNVGIGTTKPLAMLHVQDSNVLFRGALSLPGTPGNTPVSGAGTRLMWYPDKAAFRAGFVTADNWNKDSIGNYSFAAGRNPKAKGLYAVALGDNTVASGFFSTAFGGFATASGSASTAFGANTIASGVASTAFGNETDAIGVISTAMGLQTTASGDYSVSMGSNTTASGLQSLSTGLSTTASGSASAAFGSGTDATGIFSTSMGFGTVAAGAGSLSMGILTYAKSFGSVAMGRYNDSISTSNNTIWVDTDPAFIIGNGISLSTRRNAFTVAKNGETGINIANGMPEALLHLKAREASYDMHIRLENLGNSDYASMVYDGDMKFRTFGVGDFFQWRNSTNNVRMTLDDLGNLTIAGIYTPSDAKLKKNIVRLQNSLQKLTQLNGYHYNWIDVHGDQRLQTGLMAQEVEKLMPELVKTDNEGIKNINYNGMVPYMVETLKEQQDKINRLEKKVEELKNLLLKKL